MATTNHYFLGKIKTLREWQHRIPINLSIWGVQVLQNLIIFGLNWVEVAQNGLILWENGARHSKKVSKYPPAPQYTIKTSKNQFSTKIRKIVRTLYNSLLKLCFKARMCIFNKMFLINWLN